MRQKVPALPSIVLVTILLLGLLAGCVERSEDHVQVAAHLGGKTVLFPDVALERLVRDTINKPTDPITESDLENVTSLGGHFGNTSYRVRDLTGIEHCSNLTALDLNDSEIRDISLLASLTNLTDLSLLRNGIDDISALSGLTNLDRLILSDNLIDDVTPLSNLTNLSYLDLASNRIEGISSLATLAALTYLDLGRNHINDTSPLTKLANLKVLDIGSNQSIGG